MAFPVTPTTATCCAAWVLWPPRRSVCVWCTANRSADALLAEGLCAASALRMWLCPIGGSRRSFSRETPASRFEAQRAGVSRLNDRLLGAGAWFYRGRKKTRGRRLGEVAGLADGSGGMASRQGVARRGAAQGVVIRGNPRSATAEAQGGLTPRGRCHLPFRSRRQRNDRDIKQSSCQAPPPARFFITRMVKAGQTLE